MVVRAALIALLMTAMATSARAGGNSGAADTTLEFGAIRTFSSEGEAKASCAGDVVIWADRYAGYLYFPREKEYGATGLGAFACLKDAEAANYWSTGPMGGIAAGHGPGRVFPDKFPDPPTS